jgi:hypothetical protein
MDILSLPNEIIVEIGKSIALPADIVRFSLSCKDFYDCIDGWKIKWFANMRNIIKEIDSIEYTIAEKFPGICTDYDGLKTKSCRKRGEITTYSYYVPIMNHRYGKNLYRGILDIRQSKPAIKIRNSRTGDLRGDLESNAKAHYKKFVADLNAHNRVCISWQDVNTLCEKDMKVKYIICKGITARLYH